MGLHRKTHTACLAVSLSVFLPGILAGMETHMTDVELMLTKAWRSLPGTQGCPSTPSLVVNSASKAVHNRQLQQDRANCGPGEAASSPSSCAPCAPGKYKVERGKHVHVATNGTECCVQVQAPASHVLCTAHRFLWVHLLTTGAS